MNKFLLILLICVISVCAAPAPWGLAISNNNACAGFWAGDEYVAYHLPEDWTAFYPENDIITTDFGTCKFTKWAGDAPGQEEACCKSFGLNFVSDNIGRDDVSYPFLNFLVISSLILFVFIMSVILFIWYLLKKRE